MKTFKLFSKVVHTNILVITEEERLLALDILKKEEFREAGTATGQDNLPYTSDNLYILDKPELSFLKNKIMEYVHHFMWDMMKYNNNNFKMTTSWIAKSSPGQTSHWHNHNNCFYSGVFYIDTHENCGDIKFTSMDNRRYNLIVSEYNEMNSVEFYVRPDNLRLLLFPAETYHQVAKNESTKDRYSIAFNVMPTGLIGRGDSQLHYD